MASETQRQAVGEFRRRQAEAGIVRYEVATLQRDKDLVRRLAKRLVEAVPESEGFRAELRRVLDAKPPTDRGGIWRALRASPLVGADLDLARDRDGGREVEF